jgi:hypothetical protein
MAAMNVVDGKFMMKGGVRDTLFGLIGKTQSNMMTRTLGGLVEHTPSGPKPSGIKREKVADMTERSIGGPNKTVIPGSHHGMSPYPGQFMARQGKMV